MSQIVILVTKAVGDILNVRGIADEMIRFNGYPFLEKEDHAFHIPGEFLFLFCNLSSKCLAVSRVMRREMHTLQSTGLRVRDVGE